MEAYLLARNRVTQPGVDATRSGHSEGNCHEQDNSQRPGKDTLTSDGVAAHSTRHTLFNGVVDPKLCTGFKSNSVGFGAGNGAGTPGKRELSSPQFDRRAAFL